LATLGIKVAASTVWQILKDADIDPAPERAATTWSSFLRSQAEAILACDFLETVTLSGQRQYVLAVIERHPTHPHPRRHSTPHRGLGHPGRTQPGDEPTGHGRHRQVPDP
jgi:putative transposase